MMARALTIALAALLACLAGAAFAHRFHAGITDIAFNEKTGSTEIVHTYMAHDVEALLAHRHRRQFDLARPEDEALLRQYVERRFYLEAADNSRLPIRWVGLAVDAESVVIYQEVAATPVSKIVLVHDEVLIDFLPGQSNTVNLHRASAIGSLAFDRKHLERRIP